MPDDGDRVLAKLVVEAGFMSQAETTSFWNQIQAPGSPRLVQVLMQAGRLNQSQVDELRRRYQAQQRKPVTLPVGDATSSQEVTVEQAWNEALERDRILAEVLLNKRLVPLPQLQECRQIQRDQTLRLGVVIVKKGYASRSQIESAIGEVRRIGNRLPWPPQFFEAGGRPVSSRHVPPPSGRMDPPLVAPPPREEFSDFGRPTSGPLPRVDPHASQRLARDAAAASSRSGSGRQEWPMPGSGGGLARTLEDDSGGGDPFASVRNAPGPGDPMFVPLEPEDVASASGLGMPPVVSPQEDGMPTVIHRAATPKGPLPPGLGGLSGSDLDDATVLGGHSLDELNPFANFPLQPPPGDSAAITLETPEMKGGNDPVSGWGGGSDQQAAWPGSDMDILPSQSESGFGTGGGFAPLPGGGGSSGGGFGEQEDPNESDGFKISAQGGGDLPLSESGPANPVPGFNPPSGGGVLPRDGGEHSPAPAALVAASASSRERAKARLDKNTKLLRALIGLCVGIFVISIALMAYILLFSDQGLQDPGPQDPGQQEAPPETPEDPDQGQGGEPPPR